MSASGGLSQMLKGIIIGVVLIMAIIGTMSLLNDGNPLSSLISKQKNQTSSQTPSEIVAPAITLNPDASPTDLNNENNLKKIGDLNAEIDEEQATAEVDPSKSDNTVSSDIKPILEDERTPEEATATETASVDFGMMVLKSVNSDNGQAIKANFIVFDKNNVKVAESRDADNTSYRLPS